METAYRLLVIAALLSLSAGMILSRADVTATSEGRAIDDECLELADEGSCEFYTCFERRLPCGRDWYMLRKGHYYCNKVQRERENFSERGQNFLDDAQRCLTRSLKEYYQREYFSCHELEHVAVGNITRCFVENAFCDVIETDHTRFFQIYEMSDLFSRGAAKIWRAIIQLTTHCSAEALREFAAESSDTFVESVNGFFDSLANAGNRVFERMQSDD